MKINLKRTGGFGNIQMNLAFDTTTMTADAVDKLKAVVDKALPLFDSKSENLGCDTFTYDISVDDGNKINKTTTTDMGASELLELIEYLLNL